MSRIVMFFGDSRFVGATNSIPQLVDAARADFTVSNKSHNGRTTTTGLAAIDAALTDAAALGDLTDVVIMLGVNDFLYGGTSAQVADRLRQLADAAVAVGARAWIVHEPPGPIAWGGYAYMDARKWTRDNVLEVAKTPAYSQIPVRDEFIVVNWYSSAYSADQLHPTTLACRQLIANTIAAALP